MGKIRTVPVLTAGMLVASMSIVAVVVSTGPGSIPTIGAAASAAAAKRVESSVKVNGANYSVDCKTFSGSAALNPPVTAHGTSSVKKEKASITATLSGCTAVPTSNGTPVTITSGSVSGTLTLKTSDANSCTSTVLAAQSVAFQGKLKVTWHTSPSLKSSTSVLSVKSIADDATINDASIFSIPGNTGGNVSKSFTAGNAAGNNILQMVGTLNPDQLGLQCISSGGLATVALQSGYVDFGVRPSSIAVTPANSTLVAGDGQDYTAIATLPDGTHVDVTGLVGFSSSAPGVATADQNDIQAVNPGTATIRATFDGVSGSTTVTVVNVLNVTTASLPDGTVGSPYDQTLMATGGTTPYTWSVGFGPLPDGLHLDTSSGEITGTPTTVGCSDIQFDVQDSSSPPQYSGVDVTLGVDEGDTTGCS
ncbi:MAG: Ig domain-containing protein [Acidimicrobiales bacterium]|jgi:hypothetical protein